MLFCLQEMKRVAGLEAAAHRLQGELDAKRLQMSLSGEKTVHWDEDTIAEHDKERGTRMKIDEPPTPFARDVPDMFSRDEPCKTCRTFPPAAAAEEEERKEEQVIVAPPLAPAVGSAVRRPFVPPPIDMSLVTDEAAIQTAHEKEFESHRAKHYNEMEELKKWREMQKLNGGDEEDDEEE
ncbi:hypothetical protein BASA81_004059 [Batrachochytrium salamandrivorans]|nr:hypothetical protein BASA81_004059 [Batrachochytrium salamandrivorans]